MLVHRPRPAGPEPCLNAVAPSRTERVVCVDGLCTGSWLADRWARAAMPCVLGPALARQALQGGNAQYDPSAAQTMAVGLRGGRLPPASGYPAAMRATRERLRRRRPRRRQRAARLAPLQPPNRPYPLPEMGKPSADQAHRAGVAERWPAPAVQKSIEVALARLGPDDQLRRAVARSSGNPATPPNAPPLSLLRPVPGMGALLRVGLLSAIPALQRFPRGPDVGSSCRLGTWAKASAGTRSGPAGPPRGPASLTWACSAAAVLCLRTHAAGQQERPHLEDTHGKGTACTGCAHPGARAVYAMQHRPTACDRQTWRPGERRGAAAPDVSLDDPGLRRRRVRGPDAGLASRTPRSPSAVDPEPFAVLGPPLRLCERRR